MASIDEAKIREIVAQVVSGMDAGQAAPAAEAAEAADPAGPGAAGHGIFSTSDAAVDAAVQAQRELVALGLDIRGKVVEAMRDVGRRRAREFAQMTVEETGIGRVEHKIGKNEGAANLSPGMETLASEAITSDDGILIVERAPLGVINAITPTTNPTPTIINNAIIMVAAGNAVVFSPHPRAANCCLRAMAYLNDACVEAGGPRNVLTAVASPSLRNAKELMEHDSVDAVCATGGGGVVRAAMQTGKKAFAAGPGNPPALVDETADLGHAAQSIIEGASFDNDVLCIGEKACVAVEGVYDKLIREMTNRGAHLIRKHETQLLLDTVIQGDHANADMIGKDAGVILEAAGIRASKEALVVLVEVDETHELVVEELLMPIVPIVRARDYEDAVRIAKATEGGRGHTAMIHSQRIDRIRAYSRAMEVGILVANAPSFACAGIGGPGFLAMTVAGRTGEGFATPRTFTTERRLSIIGAVAG
jgi:propionaldehyde dehydrogenase